MNIKIFISELKKKKNPFSAPKLESFFIFSWISTSEIPDCQQKNHLKPLLGVNALKENLHCLKKDP